MRSMTAVESIGGMSEAHILTESDISPEGTLIFRGRKTAALPILRQLTAMSDRPFLLVGTAADLNDSCLCALNPDWMTKRVMGSLWEGSGMMTLSPDAGTVQAIRDNIAGWGDHLVIMCLGGIEADVELINRLNRLEGCVILTDISMFISIRRAE